MKNLIFILGLLLFIGCSKNKPSISDSSEEAMAICQDEPIDEASIYEGTSKSEIHMAVDLGLPSGIKWASTNVGASSPSEFGEYYAMGETKPSTSYTPNGNMNLKEIPTKERVLINGNPKYDAATANWGEQWRTPTSLEFYELQEHCKWKWTNIGGNNGYLVTGPNGNSIYLPAAGFKQERHETTLVNANKTGLYWESFPDFIWHDWRRGQNPSFEIYAFNSIYPSLLNEHAAYYEGLSIRPVTYSSYQELGLDENNLITKIEHEPVLSIPSGKIGDHEYVDLGLPSGTKWANQNIGASSPFEVGNEFEWGATSPDMQFGSIQGETLGNGELVKNITGNPKYDVASKQWGESWRIPTSKDFEELITNCVWTLQKDGENKYIMVTGPNKNKIIFPFTDYKTRLWSSEPETRTTAFSLILDIRNYKDGKQACVIGTNIQKNKLPIRPVSN